MRAFARFLSVAALVLLLAACTQNGGSIYYSIQKVQKVGSSTLNTDLTISDMVTVGSANPSAPYYVATGSIYNGPLPSNGTINWQKISTPSSMLCNALAWDSSVLGKKLWGGFFSSDGSQVGLYSTSVPTISWSQTTDPLIAGKQIVYVAAINGYIFVGCGPQSGVGTFDLEVLSSGTWTQLLSGLAYPVTGVVTFGSNYYVSTSNPNGPKLYQFTSLSSSGWTDVTPAASGSGEYVSGLFSDDGKVMLVLASSNLYYSTTPASGNWTQKSDKPVSGYNAGFLGAAGPIDNYANGGVYLVGTDSTQGGAAGFYFFSLNGGTFGSAGSISRYVNLSISLYIDAIRRVLVDANNNPTGTTNNNVFFGTINSGLWRTSIDANGNPQSWVQE